MQYLAEVQKKSGVFGGGKAELKLLACQRGDSWTAVPGEELIPVDDGGNLNGGALVFAEVSPNKQVQGNLKDASRQIVSILQSYSRLQEKTKTQEEEIKQWQESLTYQSQELNRRQMEMEAQIEQLEQINQEVEELEAKRSEIEASDREMAGLREEMERKQQELDAAWAQLEGQEGQTEQGGGGNLDAEQANSLQEWLNYLAQVAIDPNSVRDPLNGANERIGAAQALFDEHWQKLEQYRGTAEEQQNQLDPRAGEIANGWQQWHDSRSALERERIDLRVRENTLELKQAAIELLDTQMQQLGSLSGGSAGSSGGSVTLAADTGNLSAHELQRQVRKLRADFAEPFSFFSDQEEELALSRQEIEEVEAKIKDSFGAEREQLETELRDLEEGYRFLFDTVSGQLQNILERQRSMNQNQTALWQRLGETAPASESSASSVDVGPLMEELRGRREEVASQIEELQQGLDEARSSIEGRAGDLENQRNDLKAQERQLQEERSNIAQLWGKVALYQEMLEPAQENLNELRQSVEAVASGVAQIEEMGASQQEAIAQLQESIAGLTQDAAVA
ncbi:MAG: pilus motility taxis protein HmpF [Cyanobacteriota bacterium]|nr:pilus motility taxis protein HmpF [Cyanobacteriota bacterium]